MDRLGSCQRIAPQGLLILVRLFVSSLTRPGFYILLSHDEFRCESSSHSLEWNLSVSWESEYLDFCLYVAGDSSSHECRNKVAEKPVIPLIQSLEQSIRFFRN